MIDLNCNLVGLVKNCDVALATFSLPLPSASPSTTYCIIIAIFSEDGRFFLQKGLDEV